MLFILSNLPLILELPTQAALPPVDSWSCLETHLVAEAWGERCCSASHGTQDAYGREFLDLALSGEALVSRHTNLWDY